MPETAKHACVLDDVSVRLSVDTPLILENLSLSIAPDEFISMIGPSGCGKTTILRLIAGLIAPTSGSISFAENTHPQIGFVFQEPTLVPWRNVVDNVILPSELGDKNKQISVETAQQALTRTGLQSSDFRKRPSELSGGMKMRVSLARALVNNPAMLLLDEPFAALDDILRQQLQRDLRVLHTTQQCTTILVTHNIHEAVFLSDRVVVLGGNPANISDTVTIDLDHERVPEMRTSGEFIDLVTRVTELLQPSPQTGGN